MDRSKHFPLSEKETILVSAKSGVFFCSMKEILFISYVKFYILQVEWEFWTELFFGTREDQGLFQNERSRSMLSFGIEHFAPKADDNCSRFLLASWELSFRKKVLDHNKCSFSSFCSWLFTPWHSLTLMPVLFACDEAFSSACWRFHLVRRFWNQTLICVSERLRKDASCLRSVPTM